MQQWRRWLCIPGDIPAEEQGWSHASPQGSTALLACARASVQNMIKLLKDLFFGKEGSLCSGCTERWRLRERGWGLQASSHHPCRQSWGLLLRFTAVVWLQVNSCVFDVSRPLWSAALLWCCSNCLTGMRLWEGKRERNCRLVPLLGSRLHSGTATFPQR